MTDQRIRPWWITSGQQGGLQVGLRLDGKLKQYGGFTNDKLPRRRQACEHFFEKNAWRGAVICRE